MTKWLVQVTLFKFYVDWNARKQFHARHDILFKMSCLHWLIVMPAITPFTSCKIMVWHWLFFDVSFKVFKTFRLVLEPSSVEILTLVRMIQKTARSRRAEEKFSREVSRKRSVRLMCVPSTCRLLGWRCGHFQITDPLLTSRLPKRVARES